MAFVNLDKKKIMPIAFLQIVFITYGYYVQAPDVKFLFKNSS